MSTSETVGGILSAPIFWILSAGGSILLSVIANLLTPRISKMVDRFSEVHRTWTQKEQRVVALHVQRLCGDTNRLIQANLDTLQTLILACAFILFGLFPVLLIPLCIPVPVGVMRFALLLFAVTIFVLGAALAKRAIDMMAVTRLAEQRERAIQTFRAMENPSDEAVVEQEREWDRKHIGISAHDIRDEAKRAEPTAESQ